MNEYQKGRMRRKELEQKRQAEIAAAESSRANKRRTAVLLASIAAMVAAILVLAPMRFKAIAASDLDEVETYLNENIDEAIVEADSTVEAQFGTQSSSGGFLAFAESLTGAGEDVVQTTDKSILTKYLLVDRSMVQEGMTIDDVYADPEFAELAVIAQFSNSTPLLDPGEESEYYVGMLDTAQFNGFGYVLAADFAWTNTNGEVIDDILYDHDKGIAYVPKYLFDIYDPESVDEDLPVQGQLLVAYDLDNQTTDSAQVEIPLAIVSERVETRPAPVTSVVASSFDTSITFPVTVPEDAASISRQDIIVSAGGSDFPIELGDEDSSYDSETGELTMAINPLTLASLNVTITGDDVVSSFVDAITQPEEAEAVSPDGMTTWKNGALVNLNTQNFDNAVKGKAVYKYAAPVMRLNESYIAKTNKSDAEKKWLAEMQESSKYLYGPNTGNHAQNDEAQLDIYTGGSFADVVDANGMVVLTSGRQYYWQRGGGINEAFALPGYTGVSAVVSNRVDAGKATSLPLDMSGIQTLTGSQYLVAAGLCSHVKTGTAIDNNNVFTDTWTGSGLDQNSYVIMRPLYRDPKNQYVVVAFIGARVSTQSGCGVYKFRIQQPGYAKVVKTSSDAATTNGNGNYSLAGAKYDIYASEANAKNKQNAVNTVTTAANGQSNEVSLKPGTYWARETASPAAYELNDKVLGPITIAENGHGVFNASDAPKKGTIKVKKQDSETGKGLGSGSYAMSLYSADKKSLLKTVTITKDETLSFGTYGLGKYYVHEDSATYPYMTEEFGIGADAAWHEVNLAVGQQDVTVTVSDPQRRGEVVLNKVDEEGKPVAGAAFILYANQDVTSLDGTARHKKDQKIPVKEISVGNYQFDPSSQKYEVVTDGEGHIKVSGLYLTTGDTAFRLVEEQPAAGFVRDQTPVTFTLAKDESKKVISSTQGKVNRSNGIDIFTYETTPDPEDPNGPDPDDPYGEYPNVPVPNKHVGVWKDSDNLTVETAEGKSGVAIRTPSGDAQYRPTLVPTGRGALIDLSKWTSEAKLHLVNKETGSDTEVADQQIVAASTYTIYAVGEDGEKVELSFNGNSDVVAYTNGMIQVIGGDELANAAVAVLNEADAISQGGYNVAELYQRGEMTNLVGEWDDELNAWIVKDAEPAATYKVLIASQNVATISFNSDKGGEVAYGRFALEATDFFAKGWLDQAGLPKSDDLYAYHAFTGDDAHTAFSRIAPGRYLISEIKPPVDDSGNFTYLVDTKLHVFEVDEQTGLIKDVCDTATGYHTATSGDAAEHKAFVIREPRTHLLISKRSSETGEPVVGASLVLTNEEHFVIDEWVSDGSARQIDGLRAGTYYLSEAMTPQNYDKATTITIKLKPVSTPQSVVMYDAPLVVGVTVDKRQEIADPLDERYMENGDGLNNAALSSDKFGYYDYSLDVRSTANSWVDELTFTDEPKAVLDGMARLISVTTPQAWQDYDGKMNVWFKTNLTPEDYLDESGANATLTDGHENAWLQQEGAFGLDDDGDKRVEDFTGWRLWQADVPTMVATTLEVRDLELADGEYVTGVRFEYGRVEMGFTTRPTDWDRELLKDSHDDVDDILGADRMTFEAADVAADAAIAKLNNIVDGFSTDASRAAESVIAQRTEEEEAAYQKLIAEIEEYNASLEPDSDLPRKFIDAPERPAYQGDDDAVTKLNAAREATKVSIRAIFETANTPEGQVALSEALPSLKSLVAGSVSDETEALVEGKVNDLIAAIAAADPDMMSLIQESLIADLDQAVDDVINTGLAGRVHYSPAIVHMQVTDAYVEGESLSNAASATAARNGGGASDADATDETPKGEEEQGDEDPTEEEPEAPADPAENPMVSVDTDENFQSAKLRVITIDTKLALPDGSKVITVDDGQLNIVDNVTMTGLTPGKEYVLLGEIHRRMGSDESGVFADGGVLLTNTSERVAAEVVFTPTSETYSVDVPFVIDVERLEGYPAVAFEELHESIDQKAGDVVLAEHKDITDADQTLDVNPALTDPISLPPAVRRIFNNSPLAQTGDSAIITGGLVLAIGGLAGVLIWRSRRRV